MEKRTRDHIAGLVLQARGLSKCGRPEAVAIVRGERLTALCWSRLIPGVTHTPTSAVIEALLQDAKTHLYGEVTMVCSKFPSVEDFKAIYATDIREVHFFGGIDDPLAATLINNLSKDCPEQGFKIVQLLEGVQDGLQK